MRESVFETIVGFIVVLVAALFLWFALGTGTDGSDASGRYEVTARFNNAQGIERGSDVTAAGVKVGVVKAKRFDNERAEAIVTLSLDDNVILPDDTDARISTDGLLGGSYVALQYGGGIDTIATDGSGEILYTRGSVDLLTLFASFASGSSEGGQ